MLMPIALALLVSVGRPPRPVLCDSSALRTPIGARPDTLRLVLRTGNRAVALPQPWADLVLDALATRFRLPQPLPLPVFGDLGEIRAKTAGYGSPALTNEVRLTFDASGHARQITLTARSLADDADAALLAAIRRADSTGAFPALVSGEGKSITVFLSLATGDLRWPSTRDAIEIVDASVAARAVAVLKLPLHRDTRPVTPRSGTRAPLYPVEEKQASREGRVVTTFVIDERGAVMPETIRFVEFTTTSFARAVLDFLKRAEFEPATVGGCPVKQLVREPFEFQLTR